MRLEIASLSVGAVSCAEPLAADDATGVSRHALFTPELVVSRPVLGVAQGARQDVEAASSAAGSVAVWVDRRIPGVATTWAARFSADAGTGSGSRARAPRPACCPARC